MIEMKEKKKNKKINDVDENIVSKAGIGFVPGNVNPGGSDEVVRKKKKKKKDKKTGNCEPDQSIEKQNKDMDDCVSFTIVKNIDFTLENLKEKKKKRKTKERDASGDNASFLGTTQKLENRVSNTADKESCIDENLAPDGKKGKFGEVISKKKSKKRKRDESEIMQDGVGLDEHMVVSVESNKRRKKKSNKSCEADCSGDDVNCGSYKNKGAKKKGKIQVGEGADQTINETTVHLSNENTAPGETGDKRKMKRKKKVKVASEQCGEPLSSSVSADVVSKCSDSQTSLGDKEKKRKKNKRKLESQACVGELQESEEIGKCGGNDVMDVGKTTLNEPKEEKKKKRKNKDNTSCEVGGKGDKTTVSGVLGVTCGDSRDPEKVKGETVVEKTSSSDTVLGQWSTADLGSEERQNKFLRLLGGNKTAKSGKAGGGLFAVWSKQATPGGGGAAALNKYEETQLNKKLEAQFDKALEYKFNSTKSGGLGYTVPPGEGKKFYIDVNKSKSKKFD